MKTCKQQVTLLQGCNRAIKLVIVGACSVCGWLVYNLIASLLWSFQVLCGWKVLIYVMYFRYQIIMLHHYSNTQWLGSKG